MTSISAPACRYTPAHVASQAGPRSFSFPHPGDGRVAEVVRNGGDESLIQEVVDAIRESGAVAQAMERASRFITQSQEALLALPEGEPRDAMYALADYTISRKK